MTRGVAVILGSTGKNFGAGMSGGIAYVYDPNGRLDGNSNHALIGLQAPDREDAETLREVISRHREYTNSRIADAILNDFESSLKSFVKVIPHAYSRVLTAMRDARKNGVPEEDIPMTVFNVVTNGAAEEKKS
jgi:glutamate synthase (NADPH/NADH) large chain